MLDQKQIETDEPAIHTSEVRRAVSSDNVDVEIAKGLYQLIQLVKNQFFTLANSHPPEGFTKLYLGLEYDIERFKEVCAFPAIAQKFAVVFAGSVGAGKSTVLNKLLQEQVIVSKTVGVDALPTYMLQGEEDATYALNIKRQQIDFSVLEAQKTGQVEVETDATSAILQTSFIFKKNFPWANLAIIDTTGYARNDEIHSDTTALEVSRSQLNLAQGLVWIMSSKDPDLSETDASMLVHVSTSVPKIIVITQADKISPEALTQLENSIRVKLKSRNIAIEQIISLPCAESSNFSLAPLEKVLNTWNTLPPVQRFAYYFKLPFSKYQEHLDSEMSKYEMQINRYDRVLSVNTDKMVAEDINELRKISSKSEQEVREKIEALNTLEIEFFAILKTIGDRMKVLFPDPSSVKSHDLSSESLRRMLRHIREEKNIQLRDHRESFQMLELNPLAVDNVLHKIPRQLSLPILEQAENNAVVLKLLGMLETSIPVQVLEGSTSAIERLLHNNPSIYDPSFTVLM